MANIFADIKERISLLPALGKQVLKTAESQRIAKETENRLAEVRQVPLIKPQQPKIGEGNVFADIAQQFNLAKPQEFLTEKTPLVKTSTALREEVKEKIGKPLAEKIVSTPEIRQERIAKAAKILNLPEAFLGALATKTTPKEGESLMKYLNRVPYLGDVVAQKIKEKGLINDPKALWTISMAIGFAIPNIPGGEAAKKGKVAGEFVPTGKISEVVPEITTKMRADNVMEFYVDGEFKASAKFEKADPRLGLHSPEFRYIKDGKPQRSILVGATPEGLSAPETAKRILANAGLIEKSPSTKLSTIPKEFESLAQEARKIDIFKSYGAEIKGNKVILYHGTNDPKFNPRDLDYGTFLSSSKGKRDITGNAGAAEYGKFVYKIELPIKDVEVNSAGEFRFIGETPKLTKHKYSPSVYRAYNDYFGSNMRPEVIDKQTDVEQVLKSYGDKKALADFYNQAVKEAGKIPPTKPPIPPTPAGITPPTPENTIQKLIKAIDEAVPLRGQQKKLYHQELAKRTAKVAAVGEKVGGEAGFYAQLGQLKGELPKVQFEAIRKQFSQDEIDLLFNTIEESKTLLPLEKVAAKEGLLKLFQGAVPTPSEISHLREVFPKELVEAVLARRPVFQKIKDVVGELINAPRTFMATLDLSAPFRQGVFMIGRPKQFFTAFKDMFRYAVSEKAYQGLMDSIKLRPTYLKMKQGGLSFTEIGGELTKREERFMSNLVEKIPGYGVLIRGSNRAYTGFLNKLRADIFDDILKKAEISGKEIDETLLKSIADFVNAGTGRGKFGLSETGIIPQSMSRAAVVMNGVFFSPRLMASRLNLLNPYFYIQLDPLVRKEALKTLFATSGILGTIYGLWKLNGGEVGIDPRNADFGKVKIGNIRYDLLGGFQQYIKLATQLITGEIISSTTGRTITLGEGYKPLTRKDIILRFFENKTSPIASFIIGLLTGITATGQEVDVPTEVINRFIPMVVQDLYDISQEKGAEGLLYGLPAIFGVGVQTYGKQELVFGKSKLGEETAQIRPVPELAEKIRELVLGQIPLGASKSFSVETYFDQLSNLPREEAADIFDQIVKTNPELAKKLSNVVKERELGITVKDKDLKAKEVRSGDRALAIKKELDKLKTKEEKARLWNDYVRKGIITKEVARQLMKLLNQ